MESLFRDIRGHLQELDNSQKMTIKELDDIKANAGALAADVRTLASHVDVLASGLDNVQKSVTVAHAATTALAGTFASIEQYLQEDRERIQALESRMSDVEKKQAS